VINYRNLEGLGRLQYMYYWLGTDGRCCIYARQTLCFHSLTRCMAAHHIPVWNHWNDVMAAI